MDAEKIKCLGCPNYSCNTECKKYREAADRLWEMAEQYKKIGLLELSDELKGICQRIHDIARAKQAEQLISTVKDDASEVNEDK
jgi:hypothetical protein